MQKILIGRNKDKVMIVDDEIYDKFIGFSWYVSNSGYVYRTTYKEAKPKCVTASRVICGFPKNCYIVYKNGNKLDLRKENLQVITMSDMRVTASRFSRGRSQYRGVSFYFGKWKGTIVKNHKSYHLGYFDTQEEAAKAYNVKATELYGDKARLNLVRSNLV